MPASVLKTAVNTKSPDFAKNSRKVVDLVTQIKNEETQIAQGGGAKAIESQHKKGRLTARERISKLIDPGSHFFELSAYAAYEMYEEWGGAPLDQSRVRSTRLPGSLCRQGLHAPHDP